jgi:hypothetical protein
VLTLEGGIPHKTVLSGTVARIKGKGSGVTTLGSIEGLGNFGDIRVKLTSPPFLVREYPFHDKGPHARGREIDLPHRRHAAPVSTRPPRSRLRRTNDERAVFDLSPSSG